MFRAQLSSIYWINIEMTRASTCCIELFAIVFWIKVNWAFVHLFVCFSPWEWNPWSCCQEYTSLFSGTTTIFICIVGCIAMCLHCSFLLHSEARVSLMLFTLIWFCYVWFVSHYFIVMFNTIYFYSIQDRVSLCSLGCLGTVLTGHEFTEILLPLSPKCWD